MRRAISTALLTSVAAFCDPPRGCGTVYKLDTTGKESVLYSFGGKGGKYPVAGLIPDGAGGLYGTTTKGGAFHQGTVFKLTTTGQIKVLYSFGGADGQSPKAGLIRDAAGTLYGTTAEGGDLSCDPRPFGTGCGTVFKLDSSGQYTVLHSFTGVGEGTYATASLVRDPAGNLYGTTFSGDPSGN